MRRVNALQSRALPKQEGRLTQAIAEKTEHSDRQRRASPSFRDGDGILVENVRLPNGVLTTVNHRLGRVPRGVLMVSVRSVTAGATHPGPHELCDSDGRAKGRTSSEVQLYNSSNSVTFCDLWVH